MPTCKIKLYRCGTCSHIQSENTLPEDYYENYTVIGENNDHSSVYHGKYENGNDSKIQKLSELACSQDSLLDIGCGGGGALEVAQKYFNDCIGVEPSAEECKRARRKGLQVIHSFFDDSLTFDKKFSAFITTMVLEHIDNPFETLKNIYDLLEDGGVGMINIPNGEMINREKLYHQIISEHLNYYTPFSLSVLVARVGFETICIEKDDNLIELTIYVQKPVGKESMNSVRELHRVKMFSMLKDSKIITVWGAGAKAHYYSSLMRDISITHIIDSSKASHGKYVSGITLPVEAVSKEIIDSSSAIVIFATTHKEEIIKELIDKYHYFGKIIYFDQNDIKCVEGA
nr:class I SAM-dependent methyltransferase [Sporomusa sphaeroides]